MSAHALRIIGGQWRRRLLRFPESADLRPTPDRVRETLFNWLGQDLSGLACLDLFAGSGALGFEACSRNAARVVLVEAAAVARAALLDNIRGLGAENRMELSGRDALEFAASTQARFDVIFADPPYRQGWLDRLEGILPALLAEGGLLYLEAEHPVLTWGGLSVIRQGRAGQVFYHLLQQNA
ncbi:MAG: 16S rRNA (guanine(966)-N(2))-methyltransferase RsmD [Zoogloeaceae bacterium]|jgi:16S rRNA (guanine966-N2)-methyltransferase|nr:16S rRNA (guanine(966)-N(2))-methyltransferase RsmD [Zoogloeaceae bacterium]